MQRVRPKPGLLSLAERFLVRPELLDRGLEAQVPKEWVMSASVTWGR